MLPARSDLLWGWGGGRGAGQAAHPHHSQAGPTPSCILRLTWAIPGPGPTRLHWPLENPGVRPLQVDSRSQAPRHGCPRTGALGRTLAASFPQPCPRPLQHWQSFKGRCWVHPPPHCCPPEGTAHPHSELSPWISPAPPEAVSAAQSAPLAPGPFGLERWPAGSASCAPQGTYLPGVRSGCRVSGLSSVCE